MRCKYLGYFLLCFTLISCAQPKYETITAVQSNSQQGQFVNQCNLRFSQSGYCLQWAWETPPSSTQMGTIQFKIVRSNLLDNTPIPVEIFTTPQVILDMPSMGHGSSPSVVEKVDVGSYRVSKLNFFMPGSWVIHFQITQGTIPADEVLVDITI